MREEAEGLIKVRSEKERDMEVETSERFRVGEVREGMGEDSRYYRKTGRTYTGIGK